MPIVVPLMFSLDLINIDFPTFRQKQYELTQHLRIRKVPPITINDENHRGNTPSNVTNHGEAVETQDYIFYINDRLQVFRADKDFSNIKILLHQTQGFNYSNLNVVGDWLYYRHKNTFYRMDFEGNNCTKVFSMSHMYRPHFIGNWIYFYTYTDRRIYKVDINGNNLQTLNALPIVDMTVYGDRIFYSFSIDDTHFLRSMDFNGENQETIAEIGAYKMVVQDDYLFYVDTANNNLCRWDMVNLEKRELTQEKVLNFSVDGEYIYYNHWDAEQYGYPGRGLYRLDINGGDSIQLSDDYETGHFSVINQWIIFSGTSDRQFASTKRLRKDTGEIIQMGSRY